jgi:hypothetical protein
MPPLVTATPHGSIAVDLETASVEEPPVGAIAELFPDDQPEIAVFLPPKKER